MSLVAAGNYRPFRRILIANRGEIACRVMRTAQRLGYGTVAVFSTADADAPHVRMADLALPIGPAPAAQSYLKIDALMEAACRTGADAIHPGYGFLSERADFAQACIDAGLVFIGPPPAAIRAMGDKAAAKRRMLAAGVPCAAGYLGDDQRTARLQAEAEKLGLPLLVKAVAGGGGRGMRLVHQTAELAGAIESARREAEAAFGDGTLMLERLIDDARHIEIQVFCDAQGHAVHLGERDCSAQRRRQKVIEEAPSPVVDAALRAAMGRDACAAAQAVGYVGAGTVEFVVDRNLNHCFLEMNTRLQVEHPVTEAITGLDLVEWQLRVASGEPLPLKQEDIRFEGHAIEARLYAEDPYDGYRPQTGRILGWRPDGAGPGLVRIDHGIAEGGEVTPYYDAMVAKFIAHGRDRDEAVRKLVRAFETVPLLGPGSNARFLRDLVQHPQFTAAQLATTRLDEWAAAGEALFRRPAPPDWAWLAAALLLGGTGGDAGGTRPASVEGFDLTLECSGERRTLRWPHRQAALLAYDGWQACIAIDGLQRQMIALREPGRVQIAAEAAVFSFEEALAWPQAASARDSSRVCAPVTGVVAQVLVKVGDVVYAGQPLASVEAMKMELWLNAGAAGAVRAVHVAPKDSVAAGTLMIELEIEA